MKGKERIIFNLLVLLVVFSFMAVIAEGVDSNPISFSFGMMFMFLMETMFPQERKD